MPTNITGTNIADTYSQLLHISGGPAASEKVVYSAVGTATAFSLGTLSGSFGNIKFTGNTVSTLDTNGALILSPNGTGTVNISAVAITGGSITGITALAVADGGTGQTTTTAARNALLPSQSTHAGKSLQTDGTNVSWVAAGSGTVTSVAALTIGTAGTDLASSVATGTTTPVITLNVPTASAANRGVLSTTDWSAFNAKQAALVSGTNLKTVGGATLLGSGDLGIIGASYGGTGNAFFTVSGPATSAKTYTFPNSNSTILTDAAAVSIAQGGTGQATAIDARNALLPSQATHAGKNLQTDGTNVSWVAAGGSGTVTSVAALTIGTAGTDLASSVANGTTTPVITLNVPTASAANRGALSAADWSTFNAKQAAISFGTGVQTWIGAPTMANLVTAVTGDTPVGRATTDTLTNKRVTPRASTVSAPSSPQTPNSNNFDQYSFTAIGAALTIAADTGTPTVGQRLIIRLKDDGTARALTWNALYRAIGVTLPTTTVLGKTTYVGFIYNATDTKWDAVAVATEV